MEGKNALNVEFPLTGISGNLAVAVATNGDTAIGHGTEICTPCSSCSS